jgi:dienelactone hydrolase
MRTIFLCLISIALFTVAPLRVLAALEVKPVDYNNAGKKFQGLVAYDNSQSGNRPGILMVHDWMGISEKTKPQIERLAQLGYVVFAVDVYGKGDSPKNAEEAGKLAGVFKKDRILFRARLQRGLEMLKKQPGVDVKKIAVVGYCFGGTGALELARTGTDIKAVVSFHGGLDSPRPEDGKRIKARVLALHGADDPFVLPEDLAAFEREMRESKIDWQLVKYGGAVHSFTDKSAGTDNAKGAAYNEVADRRSWDEMKRFFVETL